MDARIAELERELSACQMKIGGYKVAHDQAEQELAAETKNKQQFERDWLECCDELAAAMAREKVLREKLKFATELIDGHYRAEIVEMEEIIHSSTDDTALKALLAAERERCANIVDNWDTPDCGGWDAGGISDAIRALGDDQ